MAKNYYQIKDLYPHLKHPEKYIGERPITMRSGWEISLAMEFLDKSTSVIQWSSESIIIPYQCPVRNYSWHRYFTDFWMLVKEANGGTKEYLIEIKPSTETIPPATPKRKSKSYVDRVNTYIKNQAKWESAKSYTKKLRLEEGKNIEFVIMTEKGIIRENKKLDPVVFFKT